MTSLSQLAREMAALLWQQRDDAEKIILSALEKATADLRDIIKGKQLSGHEFYTSPLETEGSNASEGALDRGQKQHAGDEILSKSYDSVSALMRGEGIPQAVQDKVEELREADHIATLKQLDALRTQAEALASALEQYENDLDERTAQTRAALAAYRKEKQL